MYYDGFLINYSTIILCVHWLHASNSSYLDASNNWVKVYSGCLIWKRPRGPYTDPAMKTLWSARIKATKRSIHRVRPSRDIFHTLWKCLAWSAMSRKRTLDGFRTDFRCALDFGPEMRLQLKSPRAIYKSCVLWWGRGITLQIRILPATGSIDCAILPTFYISTNCEGSGI